MNNKRILITGSNGFLGKNLRASFKQANIQGVFITRGSNNEYDLSNQEKTFALFEKYQPQIIIHTAAAVGGILHNLQNGAQLIRDNLLIGINILDACVKFGVENLYMTGTCCSYPDECPTPFLEESLWNGLPNLSNSSYGIAKKTIMKMAQDYRQQYGLKTTSFILANLYGKYDHFDGDGNHVIPALIKKFIDAKEQNLPVVECWGTENGATRDFLNANDLSNFFVEKVIIPQFDYFEPINLGSGREISIKDLAHMISDLIGYDGQIVFNGLVGNGQQKRLLSVVRAQTLLGWNPQTSLVNGLKQTIEWYLSGREYGLL